LQRVGEQVEALHSLVFEEQRREAIGVLGQCSQDMRQNAKEICNSLLVRIRALVQELSEVVG
jgi:hypothetical protein